MGSHIVFVICTGEHLAILHRERELIRRAESLGVTLAPVHRDDSFDAPRPRVNVGTIGHINHGKGVLALALAESFRFVRLPVFKIKAISCNNAAPGHQLAKIRKQHAEDFQRKSKQLLRPTRNFCCRRR